MATKVLTDQNHCGNRIDEAVIESDQVKLENFSRLDSNNPADLEVTEKDNATQAIEKLDRRLGLVSENSLNAVVDHCIGVWKDGDLNPDAVRVDGSKEYAKAWYPFLLDTTDNEGEDTTPVGELKMNNYFRYKNGSFAPTVGITADMMAQCMDNDLYKESAEGGYELYCNAGEYDPKVYLANDFQVSAGEDGVYRVINTKLYIKSGDEYTEVSHYYLPWETTETKYTIGVGRKDKVRLIDLLTRDNDGFRYKGIVSAMYSNFGDVDLTPFSLDPTAISIAPCMTVGGKMRSFFNAYCSNEPNCVSYVSIGNTAHNPAQAFFDGFWKKGTFPRSADVSGNSNRTMARANNSEATRPYPFAEGGLHSYNVFMTCMEIAYGTKYLNKADRFSSGISSNDSCTSEATWLANGGVKYRISGNETWSYATFGATPGNIFSKDDKATKTYWSDLLNQYAPKTPCAESQMVASWAAEFGIPEGAKFEFYGNTYWFKSVGDLEANGLDNGEMNCRVYKVVTGTLEAFNAAGEAINVEVELVLRNGLLAGVNTSGDIWSYYQGGFELVGTYKGATTGNPMKAYMECDQRKWHNDGSVTMNNLGVFAFESSYHLLSEFENQGDNWVRDRYSYTLMKSAAGGGVGQGECFYNWSNCYWSSTKDQRVRVRVILRGGANYGDCSSRSSGSYHAVSDTGRVVCGSLQARINVS